MKTGVMLLFLTGSGCFAAEIEMSAAIQRDLADLIRSRGFNCPLAKIAFTKGVDAYGDVTKVHCGPTDLEGVYKNVAFRVTAKPDGSWLVSPWQ